MTGPRQAGKTTAARKLGAWWDGPVVYAAADLPQPPAADCIETHWGRARRVAARPTLLVLDEVQKISRWSEVVKGLWDQDRAAGRQIHVVILGSSALMLARGAHESLAGRFFLHRAHHWSYDECRDAFGWDLDRWIYFGGYPGCAPLVDEEEVWRGYVTDSLIETAIARDVLALETVAKPALLRQLFMLAARLPARIISYNKMLGQLQDAGNTTTLAHYLQLLERAFLVSDLQRFTTEVRRRASSPKLLVWNNALVSALMLRSFADLRDDAAVWGWMVENAVGAHLIQHLPGTAFELLYWRHRDQEVDFVVRSADAVVAIEVKSGRPGRRTGLAAFRKLRPRARTLLVGSGGVPLEEFFLCDPRALLFG